MKIVVLLVFAGHLFPGALAPLRAAYSTDGENLLEIDLATGDRTLIGPFQARIRALAFAPSGELFGLDPWVDRLFLVDVATGEAESIGDLGIDVTRPDLTFDGCGRLWLLADVQSSGTSLARIDPEQGTATLLHTGFEQVRGIADLDGRLLVVSTAEAVDPAVHEIVPQTGQLLQLTALQQLPDAFAASLDIDSNGELVAATIAEPPIQPGPHSAVYRIDLEDGQLTSPLYLAWVALHGLATDSSNKACLNSSVVEIPTLGLSTLVTLAIAMAAIGLLQIRRHGHGRHGTARHGSTYVTKSRGFLGREGEIEGS